MFHSNPPCFFIFQGEQRKEKIEGKNKVIFKRRRKKFFFFWKWLVWCGVFSELLREPLEEFLTHSCLQPTSSPTDR